MIKNDLTKKLFDFAVSVINFVKTLPESPEVKIIKYQLIKSTSSSGANYEEAQVGSSKADFINKFRISLREMPEPNYCLRLIKSTVEKGYNEKEFYWMTIESTALKCIPGSIDQISRVRK